ncbi:MAG: cation diffusion facilitator family transporter [Hyphomicrobiaceae bacterium]|nr:cation transporter [Hyphomicrobiaceae bacterium]
MGSGHQHHQGTSNKRALTLALGLTGTFLIVEVIAGFWTGSLALISDAAHMLTDTAGLAIALAAINIGERPADSRRTFGYQRFEILAAAFNAVVLFLVAGYILFEGYKRFVEPQEIQSLPMMLVATIGLGVNLVSMRLLSSGKDSSLNVKGAYLEVWSDMLGSFGVIAAGLIIWLTGWRWVDPLVAIGIGLWVLPRTWTLLKETINVLLEGVPEGIDLDAVRNAMLGTPGVREVHDLHVWALTSNAPSLSAHLVLADGADADATRSSAAEILESRFHIEHVTLQTERTDCRDGREDHGLH